MIFLRSRQRKHRNKKGFTIIEGLVLLFIFIVGVLTLYKVFSLGMIQIIEAKKRIAAVALAVEKMEILRNTPYTDIGPDATKGIAPGFDYYSDLDGSGFPTPSGGILDPDNIESKNFNSFRVIYDIFYIDDPEDGTVALGTDDNGNDYKNVRIVALWGKGLTDASQTREGIELSSIFIPPGGLEGAETNGILSVNVFDNAGDVISGVTVSVYDEDSGGAEIADSSQITDAEGHAVFTDVSNGTQRYSIRVSKVGYETIDTLNTTASLNPSFPHQSILSGVLTTANIVTEEEQDFTLFSNDPFCNRIADVDFDIEGGRIIGTDPSNSNANVYVYSGSLTTDGSGEVVVRTDTDSSGSIDGGDKASAGRYIVNPTEPGYVFWRLDPVTFDSRYAVDVPSDATTTTDCNYFILDNTIDSFFIHVVDASVSDADISEATVVVENIADGYAVTGVTDHFGYVYFPQSQTSGGQLLNGHDYVITARAQGFNDSVITETSSGLIEKEISLSPN